MNFSLLIFYPNRQNIIDFIFRDSFLDERQLNNGDESKFF
jgi:hypothetical protein